MSDTTNKKRVPPDRPAPSERRRVANVVHDQRGNASVEWQDAPADYDRPVLEILEDAPHGPSREHGFDPYASSSRRVRGPDPYAGDPARQRRLAPPAREPTPKRSDAAHQSSAPARKSSPPTPPGNDPGRRPRTDLRKLSEWIKMMRELEARKKSAAGDDEGNGEGNGAA